MLVDAEIGTDARLGHGRSKDSLFLGTIDEVVSRCRWCKGLESASR